MNNEEKMPDSVKQQQSVHKLGIVAIRRFLGRLVRLMLSPQIYQAVMRFRLRRSLPFSSATYFGVYSSFKELAEALPTADYYPVALLSELIHRRLRHFAAGTNDIEPNDRYNFLSTLVALSPEPDVSILDVGAGFGEALEYLKIGCPGKRFKYSVLELKQVVALAKQTIKEPEIEFYTESHELRRVDLVFFGSSFQYFENRFEMLRSVLELDPVIVAISDSRMGDMPAFVTAQVNMPGRIIPNWVNNRNELVEFFLIKGYALLNQYTNPRSDNFNNFPERIKNTARSWSLVFKKMAPR